MRSYKQSKRLISLIILHCSATKVNQTVTVADIDQWHRKRGWNGIGYHIVVYQDGSIHDGRPVEKKGAHVENHNAHSIGVCYIGGLNNEGQPADTRTEAQKASLRAIMKQLHQDYPRAIILGHRDLSPDLNGDGRITSNEFIKQCPCLDTMVEYQDLQPEGFWENKPIYK